MAGCKHTHLDQEATKQYNFSPSPSSSDERRLIPCGTAQAPPASRCPDPCTEPPLGIGSLATIPHTNGVTTTQPALLCPSCPSLPPKSRYHPTSPSACCARVQPPPSVANTVKATPAPLLSLRPNSVAVSWPSRHASRTPSQPRKHAVADQSKRNETAYGFHSFTWACNQRLVKAPQADTYSPLQIKANSSSRCRMCKQPGTCGGVMSQPAFL